jgi:hypothetical protein
MLGTVTHRSFNMHPNGGRLSDLSPMQAREFISHELQKWVIGRIALPLSYSHLALEVACGQGN